MTIHATALVDSAAQVDPSVEIGPYSIIHGDVVIGPRTRIGPYCVVHPGTRLGADNVLHANVSLGDLPQSVGFDPDTPSTLEIGDGNTFREFASIHRSEREHGVTRIGNAGYFMVHSHIGHDCTIGDRVVVASGSLLAGHVQMADRAFISGNCLVHQFCAIGTLAFFRGQAAVTLDVPPYAMAAGGNLLRGLNLVGLRRAGFSRELRRALRRVYRTLFYSELNLSQALESLGDGPHDPHVAHLLEFIRGSKRGIIRAHRPGALGSAGASRNPILDDDEDTE